MLRFRVIDGVLHVHVVYLQSLPSLLLRQKGRVLRMNHRLLISVHLDHLQLGLLLMALSGFRLCEELVTGELFNCVAADI